MTNRKQGREVLEPYVGVVVQNETEAAETYASLGDRLRVYGAASNIAQVLAGYGMDEASYRDRLLGVVLAACEPNRRRDVRRSVEDGFKNGATNPRRAPSDGEMVGNRTEVVVRIGWLRDHVATLDLTRSGRVVAHVLCGIGEKAGKLRFGASYRELSELSGLARSTVERAIKELVAARVVRRAKTGSQWKRKASRSEWQLLTPKPCCGELVQSLPAKNGASAKEEKDGQQRTDKEERAATTSPVRRTYLRHVAELDQSLPLPELLDPSHDLWHRRHNAWQIWQFLTARSDAELTGSEIGRALNIRPRTARENLRWLATHDLIIEGFSGWLLNPDPPPPVVEAWAEKRRKRHAAERELHAGYLVKRAEAKVRCKGEAS